VKDEQLEFLAAHPDAFRKMAVAAAIGHALTLRGMGPDDPSPNMTARNIIVSVVEPVAAALADAAIAELPDSAGPYESILDLAQAVGNAACETTMDVLPPGPSLSEEQRNELLSAATWVINNRLLPATQKSGRLRRFFRAADEEAMKEAALLGIMDGAIAAQVYFDNHPDRLSWAAGLLAHADESAEVGAVLPPPDPAGIDRRKFSRDDEWEGGRSVYCGWYYWGAWRLVQERSIRVLGR
jgi:hypothetical protein